MVVEREDVVTYRKEIFLATMEGYESCTLYHLEESGLVWVPPPTLNIAWITWILAGKEVVVYFHDECCFQCQWRGNWFVVGPTWSLMKSPVAVLDQINELIYDPVAGAERRTTLAQTWELEEPWQTRSYLGLHQRGKWTSRWTRQCSIIRSCFPPPQAARCLSSFKTNNKGSRGAQPFQQWLRSTFGCSYYLEAMWKQNKYHLVGSWPASGCIWYVSGGRTRISNPLQVLIQMVTGLQIWIIWYIQ